MDWIELDDKTDDYVIGRRCNSEICWVESKRIDVSELREIFENR
jgi:hypothetical protein